MGLEWLDPTVSFVSTRPAVRSGNITLIHVDISGIIKLLYGGLMGCLQPCDFRYFDALGEEVISWTELQSEQSMPRSSGLLTKIEV